MNNKLSFTDLREQVSLLKKNLGFAWVSLRSVDLSKRCTECTRTIEPQYDTPSPSCTKCMGTGYLFVDKLIKSFRIRYISGTQISTEIGATSTDSNRYFIQHNERPKNTDFIMELDLDESTRLPRQPFRIRRAFKIQDAEPLRGTNGRIEYWSCMTEERSYDLGRDIVSAIHNKTKVSPVILPPIGVAAAISYGFSLTNIGGVTTSLTLGTDSRFDITTVSGISRKLLLTPDVSPPTGKLLITDIRNVDHLANLTEV